VSGHVIWAMDLHVGMSCVVPVDEAAEKMVPHVPVKMVVEAALRMVVKGIAKVVLIVVVNAVAKMVLIVVVKAMAHAIEKMALRESVKAVAGAFVKTIVHACVKARLGPGLSLSVKIMNFGLHLWVSLLACLFCFYPSV